MLTVVSVSTSSSSPGIICLTASLIKAAASVTIPVPKEGSMPVASYIAPPKSPGISSASKPPLVLILLKRTVATLLPVFMP